MCDLRLLSLVLCCVVQALERTLEFEDELATRFEAGSKAEDGAESKPKAVSSQCLGQPLAFHLSPLLCHYVPLPCPLMLLLQRFHQKANLYCSGASCFTVISHRHCTCSSTVVHRGCGSCVQPAVLFPTAPASALWCTAGVVPGLHLELL